MASPKNFSDWLFLMIISSYEKLQMLLPFPKDIKWHFFAIEDKKLQ